MSVRHALVARIQQTRKQGVEMWATLRDRALSHASVRLVVDVARRLNDHDATQMAASLAYYALLSIFPLLLGLISLFGFFLGAETVHA
ncbi:MAG: YhjD/YihY/BrkB family envelope integrity protein, partial [Chloroflexota bacterium]